jgi:hypothetical protein
MFRFNILPQSSGWKPKQTQQEESESLKYKALMHIFAACMALRHNEWRFGTSELQGTPSSYRNKESW